MSYPLWLARLLIRTGVARLIPAVNRLTDSGGAFLHHLNDRLLMSPNAELRAALPFLDAPGPEVIDLSLGAPRFDLLPSATSKLPAELRGYPAAFGLIELREAIAQKLRQDNNLALSAREEIIITAGATAGLSFALDSFLSPGDRVVLFDPTYLFYPLMVRNRRGRIVWLPTEIEHGRLRFPLDRLTQALRGAKLIVLNSPGNPTGAVLAPDDLEQIAWWADRHDVLILSDEVYERYQYDGQFLSIGSLPKARARTLTFNSLSKSHSLAAYRVGWLAGHRQLVRACSVTAALQQPFVPTLCQQLALAALRLPPESFAPVRGEFQSRRLYVFERLKAQRLHPAWPAGAFYVWLPIHHLKLTGRAFAERLLTQKRVLVLPGELFGPSGKDFIRISYAADDGRLREGLNRLADFVRELIPLAKPLPVARAA